MIAPYSATRRIPATGSLLREGPEGRREAVSLEEFFRLFSISLVPWLPEVRTVPVTREVPELRQRYHGALRQGMSRAPPIDVRLRAEGLKARARMNHVVPPLPRRGGQVEQQAGLTHCAAAYLYDHRATFAANPGEDIGVGRCGYR